MFLIEIDELATFGSGVDTIWQGVGMDARHEPPLFVIGSEADQFVDRHKSRSFKLAPPALYAVANANLHGLGVVQRDDWVVGGDGWPGLASLTTTSSRLFWNSADCYFDRVAPGLTRRRINGVALLLAHPGDNIYGHWLIDLFPLVWLTRVLAGLEVKYIVRANTPAYAMRWLEASGASKSDII